MTREDLRPRAETTLRDLCALLYPATAGHDVVVYAAGDGPWSARWRWAARVVDGRVVGETGALAPDGAAALVAALCIGRVEIPARRETLPLLQGAA